MPLEALMLSIFKPAAHQAPVAADHVDPLYRRLRWQIFMGIFFGYAATIWYAKTSHWPCRILSIRASPAVILASLCQGSPLLTVFLNSSWGRFPTAPTRAYFCP